MARTRARSCVFIVLVFLCSCHTWRVDRGALAQTPEPRARAELWIQGTPHVVHGIRVRPDSVSGVPYWQPVACDSCRLTWAIPQIDSVRVQQEQPIADLVLVALGAGLVAFILALRAGIGHT